MPEIFAGNPADFLPQHRLRFAREFTPIKVQRDGAIGICVFDGKDCLTNSSHDVEFLVKFPAERFAVGFRRTAFAAGKFPVVGQVAAWWAQGQKVGAVSFDDGSDDGNGRHIRRLDE